MTHNSANFCWMIVKEFISVVFLETGSLMMCDVSTLPCMTLISNLTSYNKNVHYHLVVTGGSESDILRFEHVRAIFRKIMNS